jgi:hypothetical protein
MKTKKDFLVEVEFEDALKIIVEALASIETKHPAIKRRLEQVLSLLDYAVKNFQTVDGWISKNDPIGLAAQKDIFRTKIPVLFSKEGGTQ